MRLFALNNRVNCICQSLFEGIHLMSVDALTTIDQIYRKQLSLAPKTCIIQIIGKPIHYHNSEKLYFIYIFLHLLRFTMNNGRQAPGAQPKSPHQLLNSCNKSSQQISCTISFGCVCVTVAG